MPARSADTTTQLGSVLMSTKLRWKLKPAQKGLSRIGCLPRGSLLTDGAKTYATISALRESGWYWVAGWDSDVPYQNTCNEPSATEDDAKKAAMAYVKLHNKTAE